MRSLNVEITSIRVNSNPHIALLSLLDGDNLICPAVGFRYYVFVCLLTVLPNNWVLRPNFIASGMQYERLSARMEMCLNYIKLSYTKTWNKSLFLSRTFCFVKIVFYLVCYRYHTINRVWSTMSVSLHHLKPTNVYEYLLSHFKFTY